MFADWGATLCLTLSLSRSHSLPHTLTLTLVGGGATVAGGGEPVDQGHAAGEPTDLKRCGFVCSIQSQVLISSFYWTRPVPKLDATSLRRSMFAGGGATVAGGGEPADQGHAEGGRGPAALGLRTHP